MDLAPGCYVLVALQMEWGKAMKHTYGKHATCLPYVCFIESIKAKKGQRVSKRTVEDGLAL